MENEVFLKHILGSDAHIISPVHGGMMNESFLVEANNKKYIAYFPPEHVKGMVNRKLEKFHQDICFDNNLSSKSIYFDIHTGIKINEYIEGKSLNLIDEFDLKKVAKMLKSFHSLKPLSGIAYEPFKRLNEYEEAAIIYQKLDEPYYIYKDLILSKKDFLTSFGNVISHNDAQRSNIVKSNDGNYYLIDFEFAADNDEIYDIATFGNNIVQEGFDLLKEYRDGNPSITDIERYYLWRIYISMQWYLVAIAKHYKGEGAIHNFNFLDVAAFFLSNAKEAYDCYQNYPNIKIVRKS